jgi:uncharacterized protein
MRECILVAGKEIRPGTRESVDLRVPDLYTHTSLTLPVHVVHSKKSGPVLFLAAALHGDEINGVEIIRRVLNSPSLRSLRGTLIAVPVVNIYGFIQHSRYLPDRRDLNRAFPGSQSGSMAGRMAYLFLNEIVAKCTHGIDLHTGAIHRENLPQVRAVLDDAETERMSRAFTVPVILNTTLVEGSLRKAVEDMGISIIVYEAGEALRFDEISIRAGVTGVIAVMREIGMLPKAKRKKTAREPLVAKASTWVRAPQSGILRAVHSLGARVVKGEHMGVISDPFGEREEEIISPVDGIIIGRTNLPLLNEGEALFHIARFSSPELAAGQVEEFQQELDPASDVTPPPEPPII